MNNKKILRSQKKYSNQFDDRELADYLLETKIYLCKMGRSKTFPGKAFWNGTGKEHAAKFPTYYFPLKWFPHLNTAEAMEP